MRTEARRPRCPVERWYWIAGQLSLLNVTACVRLTGYVPAGVLKVAAVDLAAEHPLLPVAARECRGQTGGRPSLQGIPSTVCGAGRALSSFPACRRGYSPWNCSGTLLCRWVSQQSTQRFADCCRRILLQAIA
jgi:hypothetical protein